MSATTLTPKYPHITVKLTEEDGNAFAIIARVTAGMRQAGCLPAERDAFIQEASSSDYDHLLLTCMKWVHVT